MPTTSTRSASKPERAATKPLPQPRANTKPSWRKSPAWNTTYWAADPRAANRSVQSVQAAIPADEPFTVADIIARLEGLQPGRIMRHKTVTNYITGMAKRGLLRRLDRHRGHAPSLYVVAGANVPVRPFEGMTLTAVMREVLTKPMNQTELTVCVLEAGYRATASKKGSASKSGKCWRCREAGSGKRAGSGR